MRNINLFKVSHEVSIQFTETCQDIQIAVINTEITSVFQV